MADYRLRHAQYKSDPDLQELQRLVPFIAVWDDHESSNDAWKNGAENHDEATEGSWTERKAAALQAYHEWMPIRTHTENGTEDRERIYRSFDYGNLANLVMLDTRLVGRDQQIDQVQFLLANHDETAFIDNGTPVNPYDNFGAFAMGVGNLTYATQFGQVQAAKAAIDAAVNDNRSLLGSSQETRLSGQVTNSVANGETWQISGQQVIAADVTAPNYLLGTDNIAEYTSFLSQDSATLLQTLANAGKGAAQLVAVLAGAYGQP